MGVVILAIGGWEMRPYETVDETKSIVTCNSEAIKPFSLVDIDVVVFGSKEDYVNKVTNKVSLDKSDNQKIYDSCELWDGVKTLQLLDKTEGSWWNVLATWFIGSFVIWVALNVIRGVIYYIVFGNWNGVYKKFKV